MRELGGRAPWVTGAVSCPGPSGSIPFLAHWGEVSESWSNLIQIFFWFFPGHQATHHENASIKFIAPIRWRAGSGGTYQMSGITLRVLSTFSHIILLSNIWVIIILISQIHKLKLSEYKSQTSDWLSQDSNPGMSDCKGHLFKLLCSAMLSV